MTTVAIMQPTFLPWLGYFALIHSVDNFVFLDDVQYSKQSWQSRNQIKGPDGPILLSLGVVRKPSKPLIRKVRLADTGFERKLLKSVEHNLARAPYFAVVYRVLIEAFERANGNLCELNLSIISSICALTGINTPTTRTSELGISKRDTRSDRLIAICQSLGGDTYISPPGAYGYLSSENNFATSPITLEYFNFEHPAHKQLFGDFQSHMAVIDALAHVGPDDFLPLVRSGLKTPLSPSELARNLS